MNVIEVKHLHKIFRIPHEKRNTIFEAFTGILRSKNFETFSALNDIHFSVEEGEMLGIIGDNGSGKSTLLKILSHILVPTEGSVVTKYPVTPFLELGVGFNYDFTVVENIRIYGMIMGLSARDILNKTEEILEYADIGRFRDAKIRNLSSGMQVRLAFSTAITTNPKILLLDEVLAVGDMEFQKKCLETLTAFKKKGVTIVFVSHDLQSVTTFCDRTLLLHNGVQVMLGDTREVVAKYRCSESC